MKCLLQLSRTGIRRARGFCPFWQGPSHTGTLPTLGNSGVLSPVLRACLPCTTSSEQRLTWFCVLSFLMFPLCLPVLSQKVSFPLEALFLREKIKTGGRGDRGRRTAGGRGPCGFVDKTCVFGFQCLNLPKHTLVFPLNTHQRC